MMMSFITRFNCMMKQQSNKLLFTVLYTFLLPEWKATGRVTCLVPPLYMCQITFSVMKWWKYSEWSTFSMMLDKCTYRYQFKPWHFVVQKYPLELEDENSYPGSRVGHGNILFTAVIKKNSLTYAISFRMLLKK